MFGFNGGLIGVERESDPAAAPGVWTSDEQSRAVLGLRWPGVQRLEAPNMPDIIRLDLNGVQVAITSENFLAILNSTAFQSRVAFSGSRIDMRGVVGNKFNLQWWGLDLSETPFMYVRYQRVSGTNVSIRVVGDFTGSPIASTIGITNTEVTYTFSSSTGTGYIEILNSSPGLLVHNIAFGGGGAGNVLKTWKFNAQSGLESGLIGAERIPNAGAAPGVWMLQEQLLQRRKKSWPVTGDTFFDKVSLLLHGNGTNGSTVFTDSSTNSFAVTGFGNAQISTTQSKFGGASLAFDGNGDYLRVADNDAFEIGAGDFTFEAWIYLTGYSANYSGNFAAMIACKDSSQAGAGRAFSFSLNGTASSWTAVGVTLFANNTTFTSTTGSFAFSLNTWYHVAAVRSGSNLRLYVDGNDVGGGTNTRTVQSTTTLVTIGAEDPWFQGGGGGNLAYWFPGYIDDLRITKGVARYTANFTPPSAQLPSYD